MLSLHILQHGSALDLAAVTLVKIPTTTSQTAKFAKQLDRSLIDVYPMISNTNRFGNTFAYIIWPKGITGNSYYKGNEDFWFIPLCEHILFYYLSGWVITFNINHVCVSLTHWPLRNFEWSFRHVIFKRIFVDGWHICCEIALIWMSLDFTDDQSSLVQVMAWCRQATSHYLSQCWPRSLSPYGVIRPQLVNHALISDKPG